MLLSAIDTKAQGFKTDNILKKTPSNFHLGVEFESVFKNKANVQAFKEVANSYSNASVIKNSDTLEIKEDTKKRIIKEAGRLGQEMISQANAIIEPIAESLDKGKLSEYNRNKLWLMREQLNKIKQTGTLWVAGNIAVNNKSISLNVTPSKLSSYGIMIFKNLNLLPSELQANVSCDFSKGVCSTEIYDLQTKETLLKLQP